MTTAAQLIAYLQTLPSDTEIEVLRESTRGYTSYVEYVPLVIDDSSSLIDFRGNPNIDRELPWYEKTFLQLGDK